MSNIAVFEDSSQKVYYKTDIVNILKSIDADDCDYLFVHTDIAFGRPLLKRKAYLQALYECLLELNAGTLVFPAFTYSFNNGEDFDVLNSKTSMGALIEYIRKQLGVHRSLDPLLSLIAVGRDVKWLDNIKGNNSLGAGSALDILHHLPNVKFLFFGAEFEEYFTYVHYVEKMHQVEYRFDKEFSGKITDYEGNTIEATYVINTQCAGITLNNYSNMKQDLIDEGKLKIAKLGDLDVVALDEADAYAKISFILENNPYGFARPYTKADLVKEYTFGKNGERVTHC